MKLSVLEGHSSIASFFQVLYFCIAILFLDLFLLLRVRLIYANK